MFMFIKSVKIKKIVLISFFFLYFGRLFAETISMENFIVKELSNRGKKNTFYLGQIKSESEYKALTSYFHEEIIGDYSGYKNVVKVYDENIELLFMKSDVFRLVEIKIKTSKYILYNTSIKVGTSLSDAISNYHDSFENYKNEGKYYFAEYPDIYNEFSDVSFLNISLEVKNEIINSIVLYYSYTI